MTKILEFKKPIQDQLDNLLGTNYFSLSYDSEGAVLGVSVLGIPQNWVLYVVYQLFRRTFFGTLTAVLLHRRKRILITTFFLSFHSISVL